MMKKARFREARDRRSMAKPNVGVLVEKERVKEYAREEDQEEIKKNRRVLGGMSNQHADLWSLGDRRKMVLPTE